MNEGDVVVVLGKTETRVRDEVLGLIMGTILHFSGDSVSVLLPDGLIWHGPKREVAPVSEQLP